MAGSVRAGLRSLRINGVVYRAVDECTYNLGGIKRDELVGQDAFHGFKETPVAPFCEVGLRDDDSLDVAALKALEGAAIILDLRNGKSIVFTRAAFAGDGQQTTQESVITAKFVAESVREVMP